MTTAQETTHEIRVEERPAMDLLRFATAGSVDDGKSTLIGRLLYDTKQIFEDQLDQVAEASVRRHGGDGTVDLALLTDGLRAEREEGITIDEVVGEIAATNVTERGETRADDRVSEAAMEDRKRVGYF